jgi:hypothetical protein
MIISGMKNVLTVVPPRDHMIKPTLNLNSHPSSHGRKIVQGRLELQYCVSDPQCFAPNALLTRRSPMPQQNCLENRFRIIATIKSETRPHIGALGYGSLVVLRLQI